MNDILFCDRIQAFLQPLIGERVARHLIISYCARQNKQPRDICEKDLQDLGKFFYKNLKLFVGSSQSKVVLNQIVQIIQKWNSQ